MKAAGIVQLSSRFHCSSINKCKSKQSDSTNKATKAFVPYESGRGGFVAFLFLTRRSSEQAFMLNRKKEEQVFLSTRFKTCSGA